MLEEELDKEEFSHFITQIMLPSQPRSMMELCSGSWSEEGELGLLCPVLRGQRVEATLGSLLWASVFDPFCMHTLPLLPCSVLYLVLPTFLPILLCAPLAVTPVLQYALSCHSQIPFVPCCFPACHTVGSCASFPASAEPTPPLIRLVLFQVDVSISYSMGTVSSIMAFL